MKELIIIGAGGHSRSVIEIAENTKRRISGIIDINYNNQFETIINYRIIGNINKIKEFDPNNIDVFIAIGDTYEREKYFYKIKDMGYDIQSLISTQTIISKHALIKDGVFINSGAIINAKSVVNENTIVNTGAIIDHETIIGAHSHICPGAKCAGRVSIGNNTFVGIGANIIDNIIIGDNVTIGAGSVIIEDVESNSTVVGIPGRKIK